MKPINDIDLSDQYELAEALRAGTYAGDTEYAQSLLQNTVTNFNQEEREYIADRVTKSLDSYYPRSDELGQKDLYRQAIDKYREVGSNVEELSEIFSSFESD